MLFLWSSIRSYSAFSLKATSKYASLDERYHLRKSTTTRAFWSTCAASTWAHEVSLPQYQEEVLPSQLTARTFHLSCVQLYLESTFVLAFVNSPKTHHMKPWRPLRLVINEWPVAGERPSSLITTRDAAKTVTLFIFFIYYVIGAFRLTSYCT